MSTHDDIEFEESSGNVFQDLDLDAPEEELSKARLAWEIVHLINKRKLNRTQAAKLLEISQPKASHLLTGHTEGFSTERLLRFLTLLGQDVRIIVSKKQRSSPHGRLLVQTPSLGFRVRTLSKVLTKKRGTMAPKPTPAHTTKKRLRTVG